MDAQVTDVAEKILMSARTIAVVGLSPDPRRPSHGVARYLQRAGYHIIPVNPNIDEVLGERAYPSLRQIPQPVDVVEVFRRSEFVGPIVDDAIAIKASAIWLQDGVVDEEAAARAGAPRRSPRPRDDSRPPPAARVRVARASCRGAGGW